MACSTGVDRAAIGDGKEEAVVLWPGICSTIVSFRYHFILGVSRFLTVCETSPLYLFPPAPPPPPSSLQPRFRKRRAVARSILLPPRFLFPACVFRGRGLLSAKPVLLLRLDFRCARGRVSNEMRYTRVQRTNKARPPNYVRSRVHLSASLPLPRDSRDSG